MVNYKYQAATINCPTNLLTTIALVSTVAVGHLYETQPEYKELRRAILHAIEQGQELDSGPDYPVLAQDISSQIVSGRILKQCLASISPMIC